jgi:transposase-like protein
MWVARPTAGLRRRVTREPCVGVNNPSPASSMRNRQGEVTDMLTERFPTATDSMRDARTNVLAFTVFPRAHGRKIWSNNPLERLNKEVKRRTSVVGIFANDTAAVRLIGAVLADQHDEWAIARRDAALAVPERSARLRSSTPRG